MKRSNSSNNSSTETQFRKKGNSFNGVTRATSPQPHQITISEKYKQEVPKRKRLRRGAPSRSTSPPQPGHFPDTQQQQQSQQQQTKRDATYTSITLHQGHPPKRIGAIGSKNSDAVNIPPTKDTRNVLDDQNERFKMDTQIATYSQSAQKMKFWNDAKHWGIDHLNVFGITFQKCQHSLWDDSDDDDGSNESSADSFSSQSLELSELCNQKITQKRIADGSAAMDAQLSRGTRSFLSLLRSAGLCATAASALSGQAALFSLLELLELSCFPFALGLSVKKFLPIESSLISTESDIVVGRIATPAESFLEALPLIAFVQESGSAGGRGCLAACLLACAWDAVTRFDKKDPVLWGGIIRGTHVQMFRAVLPSSFVKDLEVGTLSVVPRVHVQELPSFDLMMCEQRTHFIKLLVKLTK